MSSRFHRDCVELLIDRAQAGRIDRRTFLAALGALGAAPAALRLGSAEAAVDRLVVCNWGGDSIDVNTEAFGTSFTAETGIEVLYDGAGPTDGALRAQAESGSVTWDCVECDHFTAEDLATQGIVRPIDYDIVDRDLCRNGVTYPHHVSTYYFSYVLAYDTAQFPDGPPQNWVDFWNVQDFPGKRGLWKWNIGNMEAALFADGVAREDIYPIDVDRAMAKIEELKPHVGAFWSSGAESQQLLLDGEVSCAMIWSTRASVLHRDTDGQITYTFNQATLNPGGFGVMNNNPAGAEVPMQYIRHCQNPEGQLALFKGLGNGPANPATDALIPADMQIHNCVSEENWAKQVLLDVEWYRVNYVPALDRFLALIAE